LKNSVLEINLDQFRSIAEALGDRLGISSSDKIGAFSLFQNWMGLVEHIRRLPAQERSCRVKNEVPMENPFESKNLD